MHMLSTGAMKRIANNHAAKSKSCKSPVKNSRLLHRLFATLQAASSFVLLASVSEY
jgi:hypothetical protein